MTPERHIKSSSYYYCRHVAMLQKFAGPLVGAPFCGAPVRPNMLNMPKSAFAPLPGELNTRGVTKYSDFGPIEGYISETVQDRR